MDTLIVQYSVKMSSYTKQSSEEVPIVHESMPVDNREMPEAFSTPFFSLFVVTGICVASEVLPLILTDNFLRQCGKWGMFFL